MIGAYPLVVMGCKYDPNFLFLLSFPFADLINNGRCDLKIKVIQQNMAEIDKDTSEQYQGKTFVFPEKKYWITV